MTGDKWVVYTIATSINDSMGRVLGVANSRQEAEDLGAKWWKAFRNGEKATPEDYAGISWQPTADFEQWKEPDND